MRRPTHTYPWPVSAPLFFALFAVLCVWSLFWIIRLAVRYGVNDAIRMNRGLLAPTPPASAEIPTDR